MEPDANICTYCLQPLTGVFVKCTDCAKVVLCLSCFCCGAEAGAHKRSHSYQIKTVSLAPSIPVFGGWDTNEELKLLEALEQYGVGNWEDVSFKVESKSPKQCALHYSEYYLTGVIGHYLLLSRKRATRIADHTDHPNTLSPQYSPAPSVYVDIEDQQLLGYMPARGDFERDYDNDAESILCRLHPSFSHDELEDALKVAQVGIYMQRLRERQRRKEIAREHGLIAQILAFILNKKIKKHVPTYHKTRKQVLGGRRRYSHFSPRKHFYQTKLTTSTVGARKKKAVTSTSELNSSLPDLGPTSPPPGSWLAAPFVLQSTGATRGTPLVTNTLPMNSCILPCPGRPRAKRDKLSRGPCSTSVVSSSDSHTIFYLNEKLKPFLRYFTGLQGKQFMDGLFREGLLKHEIKYLLEHRTKNKVKFYGGKPKFPYFKSSVYNAPQKPLTSALATPPVKIRRRRHHASTPWYLKVQRRIKRSR